MNTIHGTSQQILWLNKRSSILLIITQMVNIILRFDVIFTVDIILVFYRIGDRTLRDVSINLFKMKMMADI